MPNIGNFSASVNLDFRKAEAQAKRFQANLSKGFQRNGFSRAANDARDFEKTLGAATNRVVAFGAAAVVFNTLSRSVSAFATSLIEVDKALAEINVNLGQSAGGLKQFGADLFNVARQTGQTFETAAKAATELARQGLSAEETIKRLKDALILSRISGLDSAEAVNTLTAAINGFNQSALTSTEVINKFVAVDTKFAVSSKDLAQAMSRVGSTAQAAGVGIDELIALVTSLQQTTQRGGATIGNGLKTIFTRLQSAPETVSALQSVGVAIKDTSGNLRSAIDILRDYGKARERLGEAERQSLDRTVAGTYQINILKAALTDLARGYSVYDSALTASAGATDEAIRKNAQLNQTLSALLNQTGLSIKQLVASIGSQDLGPTLKTLLQFVETARKYLSEGEGETFGKSLGQGILRGIANVLSGPGLAAVALVLFSTFKKIFSTITNEAQALFKIGGLMNARIRAQERIDTLAKQATAQEYAQLQAARGVLAQKEVLLAIQQRINRELLIGTELQNALVNPGSFTRGASVVKGIRPGFADPVASAIAKESRVSGLPASQIYVDKDPRVASPTNPGGVLVANRRDEPLGGYQGVNRVISQGGNPKTGSVPGFANEGPFLTRADRFRAGQEIRSLFEQLKKVKPLSEEFHAIGSQVQDATAKLGKVARENVLGKLAKEFNNALLVSSGKVQDPTKIFFGGVNKYGGKPEAPNLPQPFDDIPSGQLGAPDGSTIQRRKRDLGINSGRDGQDYTRKQRRRFREEALYKRDLINDSIGGRADSLIDASVRYDSAQPGIQARANRLRQQQLKDDYRKQIVNQRRAGSGQVEAQRNARLASLRPQLQEAVAQKRATQIEDLRAQTIRQAETRARLSQLVEARKKEKADTIAAAAARRDQRFRQGAFGAAIALPIVAGFIPEGKGGTESGIAGGAAQGAAVGASLGVFGPAGLAIGVALGGLAGAFGKLQKSSEELAEELGQERAERSKQTEELSQFISLQQSLDEALSSGNIGQASKISAQQDLFLRSASAGTRGVVARVGTSTEALSNAQQEQSKGFFKDEVAGNFKQAIADFRGGVIAQKLSIKKSDDQIKTLAKAIAAQSQSQGIDIPDIKSFTRGDGKVDRAAIDNANDFLKQLGNTENVGAFDGLVDAIRLARDESAKNAAITNKLTKSLKEYQNIAIQFNARLKSTSLIEGFGALGGAGRRERGMARSGAGVDVLSGLATSGQQADLRGRLDIQRTVAGASSEQANLENKFRADLRESLKSVFDTLNAGQKDTLFSSQTSTSDLQAGVEGLLPGNDNLAQTIREYQTALDLNKKALDEDLKTIELKTKLEKEVTEIIRRQTSFSGGSIERGSDAARGLGVLGREGERTPRKRAQEDAAFTEFFEQQKGLGGDTSALQGTYNQTSSRTNLQKFLAEAEETLRTLTGGQARARDDAGNLSASAVRTAAGTLSRYRDPTKAAAGKYILQNLEAQQQNVRDAALGQGRINGALSGSVSINPEELLNKQVAATAKLQETLNAFSQKSTEFTINLNTKLELVGNGLDNMQGDNFKQEAEAAIKDLFNRMMSMSGKPVPPTPPRGVHSRFVPPADVVLPSTRSLRGPIE